MSRIRVTAGLLTALLAAPGATEQQVDFTIADTLTLRETELPYTIDLVLSVAAATRIGVDAVLDLRDVQASIPERVAEQAVVDNCGLQVEIDNLTVTGDADAILLDGAATVRLFECTRTDDRTFRRGAEKNVFNANLSTAASVELRDNCVFFQIRDLTLTAPDTLRQQVLEDDTLDNVKELMLAALAIVLGETPLCPELPAELASLDPIYDSGGPREIGDGGVGVAMRGSIDVSTSTLLDVLAALQELELIPGPP